MKHVYVLDAGDLVKVGISKSPESRSKNISNAGGREIINQYVTGAITNAREVEREVHAALRECRRMGEWFDCTFRTAVELVRTTVMKMGIPSDAGRVIPLDVFTNMEVLDDALFDSCAQWIAHPWGDYAPLGYTIVNGDRWWLAITDEGVVVKVHHSAAMGGPLGADSDEVERLFPFGYPMFRVEGAQQKSLRGFFAWLDAQAHRDDPIGDLARDTQHDHRDTPRGKIGETCIMKWYANANASYTVLETARQAIREFVITKARSTAA